MGACISEDLTIQQIDEPPKSAAEQQRSLVDFVRALSTPSIIDKPEKETQSSTINNIEDLTPNQEEFLSKYKMRVYGSQSELSLKYSTFNIIENEFYNKFHKQISRGALYDIYGLS